MHSLLNLFRSSSRSSRSSSSDNEFESPTYGYMDSPINATLYDRSTAAASSVATSRKASSEADSQYDWYLSPQGDRTAGLNDDDVDNPYYYGGSTYSSSSLTTSIADYDFAGNVDSSHDGTQDNRKHLERKEHALRRKPLLQSVGTDDPELRWKPLKTRTTKDHQSGTFVEDTDHPRKKTEQKKHEKRHETPKHKASSNPYGLFWKPLTKPDLEKPEKRPVTPKQEASANPNALLWKPLTKPDLERPEKRSATPKHKASSDPNALLWKPLTKPDLEKPEKRPATPKQKASSDPDALLWKPLTKPDLQKPEKRSATPKPKATPRPEAPLWKPLTKGGGGGEKTEARPAKPANPATAEPRRPESPLWKPLGRTHAPKRFPGMPGAPEARSGNKELTQPSSSDPAGGMAAANTASRPPSRPKRRPDAGAPTVPVPSAPAPTQQPNAPLATKRPRSAPRSAPAAEPVSAEKPRAKPTAVEPPHTQPSSQPAVRPRSREKAPHSTGAQDPRVAVPAQPKVAGQLVQPASTPMPSLQNATRHLSLPSTYQSGTAPKVVETNDAHSTHGTVISGASTAPTHALQRMDGNADIGESERRVTIVSPGVAQTTDLANGLTATKSVQSILVPTPHSVHADQRRATVQGTRKEVLANYVFPESPSVAVQNPGGHKDRFILKMPRWRKMPVPSTAEPQSQEPQQPTQAAEVAHVPQFTNTPVQPRTGNSPNSNSVMASANAAEPLPNESNQVDDAFPRHSVYSIPENMMRFANMNGKSFRRLTSIDRTGPQRLERQDDLPPRKWAYVSHFASEYRKALSAHPDSGPSSTVNGRTPSWTGSESDSVASVCRTPLDRHSLFNSQRTTRSAVSPASTVVDEVIDDDGRVLHAPTTSFLWHTGEMSWKSAMPMPDESSGPPAENLTPASVASDGEPPESMRFPTMPSEHKRRQTVVTVLSAQSETVGRIFPPLEQRRQSAPLPPAKSNVVVPMPPVRHTQAQVVQPTRPVYAPPPPMSLHPRSKPAPVQPAVATPAPSSPSTVYLSPQTQPPPQAPLNVEQQMLENAMRDFVPQHGAPQPQPKYGAAAPPLPNAHLSQRERARLDRKRLEKYFGYRLKDVRFVDSPQDLSLAVQDDKKGRRRQKA